MHNMHNMRYMQTNDYNLHGKDHIRKRLRYYIMHLHAMLFIIESSTVINTQKKITDFSSKSLPFIW